MADFGDSHGRGLRPGGADEGPTVQTQNIPAELAQYFEGSHIALALAAATEDNSLMLVNEPAHRLN